ncbi:hypothetical protein HNY73_021648 [Argiope bruennichi]|uniref:Uncharacterized protein n=1 Tax=Argiope bruennichi TaxID=94029 RepID=A0A8T0DZ54_ARGBR|nr:hypothetical protein HNY73_021648 [Argiope bruennichi]
MYAGDYRNTSESKPDQHFNHRDIEFNNNSYELSEDHLMKTNPFENKNENSQNTFQFNKAYALQSQNKEFLLKNNNKLENVGAQHFDGGSPVSLPAERRENLFKDKRIIQTKQIGNNNFPVRPHRKCLGSQSAPSLLPSASTQHLSNERSDNNQQTKSNFKNGKCLVEQPKTISNKVPAKVQPSNNDRKKEMKSNQRNKNINIRKRLDSRKRLKIPVKRIQLMGNGEMPSHENGSLASVDEIKYVPDTRNSDETDRCSSYSEADLRYVAEKGNLTNERNMPHTNFQQSLKQSIPTNPLFDSMKYISNIVCMSNYERPYEESANENCSKKTDSRFTTDSFLRKELSDYKEFLLYRRNLRKQNLNREPKFRTANVSERFKFQERKEFHNQMPKNDYKNRKEYLNENRQKIYPHSKAKHVHKTRRPKVSEEQLWKRFEYNFKRYATTKRYSGEVIPRKISTEWMSNMGVVGDLLTEKDADVEFKKAAGSKITMNIVEYKEFLINLTLKKKLPYYEIYRRMCGM